ncbi:acyl carrier protein 4 [Artemisia annua]|uniref:Acyl carrier protein n=1 Tax=Artemisia annua TaxID=35608 RepID=A0A2U1Q955_ARTAN|nr:acyl carrier protein 4 [Artemisia annua]
METPKTYISELTTDLNPCTIKVKVLRAWCYREANMQTTHRHFEMIVADEKGDKIHVIVNNGRLTFLEKYFKEDMVVLLRNFSVIPNNTSYKYTKHPYKISYDGVETACRSNTFDADAKPETVNRVCEIVKTQLALGNDSKVEPDSKFSALGADSLDTVEIVMTLEEEFGISVEEENSQNITTVQEAADLIEKLVEKKNAPA